MDQMNLPIQKPQALAACAWLHQNYGPQLRAAVDGSPFTVDLLCGIACQETAVYWWPWITRLASDEVLARCVFDGSGDVSGAPRSAFPRNTEAFRVAYGAEFTALLVAEGNQTRAIRGLKPWRAIYKGYGLFQYDLQFVRDDEEFFRGRLWYSIEHCLSRVMRELTAKMAAKRGDLWAAVKAYNGAGLRASIYAQNVEIFTGWAKEAR